MSNIEQRSNRSINLADFSHTGSGNKIGKVQIQCPEDRQYILRMPIRVDGKDFNLPSELEWMKDLLNIALVEQSKLDIDHPFCYVTVRHGIIESLTDDEWHVDGFSTKVEHKPEQNYIWSNHTGTEIAPVSVKFPDDFNPLEHNVNHYLEGFVDKIVQCEDETLYCVDPYILHRRPTIKEGTRRTFVRVSFVPIKINDINNTQNDLIPQIYDDGVKRRNELKTY